MERKRSQLSHLFKKQRGNYVCIQSHGKAAYHDMSKMDDADQNILRCSHTESGREIYLQ